VEKGSDRADSFGGAFHSIYVRWLVKMNEIVPWMSVL